MGSRAIHAVKARRWSVGGFVRALSGGIMLALAAQSGAAEPGLVRVDQHIADRDLLAVSMRYLEPDYRQDLGFEHLYEDPSRPGQYVRRSGAMWAISPRTDYVSLKSGVYAAVSPGTVFYIGGPPSESPVPNGEMPTARSLSVSVSAPLNQPVPWAYPVGPAPVAVRASADVKPVREHQPEAMATPAGPRDMSDPSYRVARLREIARLMGVK